MVLNYIADKAGKGILVLEKDNPSDLPQNNDSLIIPIKYEKAAEPETIRY